MIRLLLILVIIGLVAGATRRLSRPGRRPRVGAPEKLVKCEHCGVYVTEASAVAESGRFYCSEQHRQAVGCGSEE